MPITIWTSNNKYEYYYYNDIPKELYPQIEKLNCHNCNLDNIDFIAFFFNLKHLIANNNIITHIPLVNSIEILEIYNNKITELPIMPNLLKLFASNNDLSKIPYFENLEVLDVSHNNLTNLICNKKLKYLYAQYNKLKSIEFKGNELIKIDVYANLLTNINFIFDMIHLNIISYNYNPIKYMPIYILRLFNKSTPIKKEIRELHELDEISINKIKEVMNIKPKIDYKTTINEINKSPLIADEAKDVIKLYCDVLYTNSKIRITSGELLLHLWSIIKKTENVTRLNEIGIDNDCNCTSCILKDIINCT
jgi:hypothetical protein